MGKVRTRFAPSPTGFLHIGGLRTALFAFLFARHNNGDFILRIEDTDRSRFVAEALDDIISSLKWIGLHWNEGPDIGGPYGPYLQSKRKDIYTEQAQSLVTSGHAYKCFCTPERLNALREEQKKRGGYSAYDRHCRYLSKDEILHHEKNGSLSVIRLKIPETGQTVFHDQIRGTIRTDNGVLDDIVLLKSDGFPTYHLANVVDDHLMKITHVIRGDEWISSTPRHILLYAAFGWTPPAYSHVPVILAQGGGKLSKRHGATMVKEFREKGYLSEALLNFISLLGWSLDDKSELFSMQELIKYFDLSRVNKASAVFSYEKLDWFNGVYIRKKQKEELYSLVKPFLIKDGILKEEESDKQREYVLNIIPLVQERLKYLSDISNQISFFFDEHFQIREPDALIPKKHTKVESKRIIENTIYAIQKVEEFHEAAVEEVLRSLIETLGMKAGVVFMTVRVAITGTKVSPGLFETMCVLGKERVTQRLKYALEIIDKM